MDYSILYWTNDFQKKLKKTQQYIQKMFEKSLNNYIAFSFGKDSMVLSHIICSFQSNIPHIFTYQDESMFIHEYDEMYKNLKDKKNIRMLYQPNFEKDEYKNMDFDWFTDYLVKFTNQHDLCQTDEVVEEKKKYDGVFVWLRAEESKKRERSIKKAAKNNMIMEYKTEKEGVWYRSTPLWFWTEKDIWIYTNYHQLPVLEAYEEINRTSDAFLENNIREQIKYMKKKKPEKLEEMLEKYPFLKIYK